MATSRRSTQNNTGEQLTLLPEGSHASRSAQLGDETALKIQDTSGQKCLESYEKLNPGGLWQRMFSGLLIGMKDWYSKRCYLTWKLKGTKHRRLYFRLVPSTPRTDGIESGLLHTPRAVMPEETPENFRERMNSKRPNDRKDGFPNLAVQIVSMLPTLLKTPSAVETEGGVMEIRKGANAHYKLRDQIAMLPTPTSRDHKDGNGYDKVPENSLLPRRVGNRTGLKLQPNFVEWMMGYPQNYTDLNYQNQDIEWND